MPIVASKGLVVIGRDQKIRTRPGERELLRDNGLRVFRIGGKQDKSSWDWLTRMVRYWDDMEQVVADRPDGPWFYLVNQTGLSEVGAASVKTPGIRRQPGVTEGTGRPRGDSVPSKAALTRLFHGSLRLSAAPAPAGSDVGSCRCRLRPTMPLSAPAGLRSSGQSEIPTKSGVGLVQVKSRRSSQPRPSSVAAEATTQWSPSSSQIMITEASR